MSAVRRVVYVCPEPPYPRSSGGRFRIDALRRALTASGAEVRLVIVGERPPPEIRRRLREEGGRVFPPRRERTRLAWAVRCTVAALAGRCIPAARYLSRNRVQRLVDHVRALAPELVLLGDVYLAAAFAPALRDLLVPIVVDTHDAASRVHARIASASGSPATWLAYRILSANTGRLERETLPFVAELWTASPEDARFYREEVGLSNVVVAPNVVDFPPMPATVGAGEARSAVFTGSFSYWPNEDAALRLIEMSYALHSSGALTRLYLVGVAPTARMRAAAARAPHVVVTGYVPDVAPYLARAAVVAAPLAAGSGTKLKILEAMAAARPVVTTPIGAEGLGLTTGVHAEVAPLDAFPRLLGELLADPARQAALAVAGRRWAEATYSRASLERIVLGRVERLGGRPPPPDR